MGDTGKIEPLKSIGFHWFVKNWIKYRPAFMSHKSIVTNANHTCNLKAFFSRHI